MTFSGPGHSVSRLFSGAMFFLAIFLGALFLVTGCGGGGGGGGVVQNATGGGTIAVKVTAPDELRLNLAAAGREVPRAMVWLDTQPANVYLTNEKGEYTFSGVQTGVAHRVVCRYDVAATGELFLARSAAIVLGDASSVHKTDDLPLEKGLYSISGILRNQFGNVIPDARLSLWGIPFKSGSDGSFSTPALPSSAAEEKISIEAQGYRSMQITLPFLHSQNTMSAVDITLSDNNEPNFAPVVFFSSAPQMVNPGERVQIKIAVIDPDEYNIDKFVPVWNNPPGFLEKTADRFVIWWTAPDSPGLATISVSIADSRGACGAAGIGIAVGGQRLPVVRIDKVEPSSSAVGQRVVISGSGFGNSAQSIKVSFNGLDSTVQSCSDDEIITLVPPGATTGILLVSINGNEKSAGIFAVVDAGMAVEPQYGPVGTVVRLTGKDFGTDPVQGSVYVNGTKAEIIAWSDSQIDFTVPAGSTAGVVMFNLRGREKTAGFFKVTRMFSISALKATTGTLLTITGEGWGTAQAASMLSFSPEVSAFVNSWSDARLVITVPAGARSGTLVATVSGKTFDLAELYINAVKSVAPERAVAGDEMTITGTGFASSQGTGYVAVGDRRLEVLSWSDNAIKIRIPSGTRPGNLVVRAGDIDSNGIPVVVTAISSISHLRRPAGAPVKISGYGFGSNTGFVLFGDVVSGEFSIWQDDLVETTIPEDATGTVQLTVSNMGVRAPAIPFSVVWVDGIDQTDGWPGRELIISGNNLGDGSGNDQVTINGVVAPVISWNDREIRFRVPVGTTTGPVILTISDWPFEITDEFTVYNSYEYAQQIPDWSGKRINSRPLLPGLSEDSAGNIYVADYDNGWVWKLAADGTQSKFGNLSRPWGIAISPLNGRLYVAESGGNCLQVFDAQGNLIEKIGASGSANGQFSKPRGLVFDKSGFLYIADSGNSRIQVFNTTGNPSFKAAFGSSGTGNGQFVNPSAVAVDSQYNVYVADVGNHRVQRFSPDSVANPAVWNFNGWIGSKDPNLQTPGWLVTGSGLPSAADGGFYNPYGIGLAGDEKILVADSDNNRVQVIDALTGGFVCQIGAAGTTSGQYNQPLAVCYLNGRALIADSSNARVQKSTLSGEYISEVLPDTSQLNTRPGRIAVDSLRRRVYVLDIDDGSITVFGLEGQVLQVIGSRGAGSGQFYKPEGLALDLNGNVLVADTGNARIHIISPEGVFLKTWGVYGTGAAQFISPNALAASSDGAFIFVTDSKQNRIQKFTRDGVSVKTWGSSGSGDDGFSFPSGIAADQKGNLYIADRDNHRIKKYSLDGAFIGWWGSYDAGAQTFWLDPDSQRTGAPSDADGGFDTPTDVAVDSHGKVYVADSGNFRVQVFGNDQSSAPFCDWQAEIYAGENLGSLTVDEWATVYTIPTVGIVRRYAPEL